MSGVQVYSAAFWAISICLYPLLFLFFTKNLWDSFISSYARTHISVRQHCFGWDYSKTWTKIFSHLSPWNPGPLAGTLWQFLLIDMSFKKPHVFRVQESLFHFFPGKKTKHSELGLSTLSPPPICSRHCLLLKAIPQFFLTNQILPVPATYSKQTLINF